MADIITRINRARFVLGEDYDPEDLCRCGRQLDTDAVALDVLDDDDTWVDGEFICAECARPWPRSTAEWRERLVQS